MKVLFVGLGSIAVRHIRNMKKLDIEDLVIEVIRSGKGKEASDDIISTVNRIVTSEKDLSESYDAVFITNPTSRHYDTLVRFNDYSDNFFVEKPVFVTGEENIHSFLDSQKNYYVACPLRYASVIKWLKDNMDFSHVYSMRIISSSYLPDWRPNQDYRDTYSAHKDMGGGVSIDLIHEWDYITHLIGFPKSVKSYISKKSNLEIDSDDIAIYIAEYSDKVVEVHLDYFGKQPIRKMELFTEEDTIVADLIKQKIDWLKSGRELIMSEDRDSYQKKELLHFFDITNGNIESDNSIEEACRVLRIARGIE